MAVKQSFISNWFPNKLKINLDF